MLKCSDGVNDVFLIPEHSFLIDATWEEVSLYKDLSDLARGVLDSKIKELDGPMEHFMTDVEYDEK